jgi:hypothetical protein
LLAVLADQGWGFRTVPGQPDTEAGPGQDHLQQVPDRCVVIDNQHAR